MPADAPTLPPDEMRFMIGKLREHFKNDRKLGAIIGQALAGQPVAMQQFLDIFQEPTVVFSVIRTFLKTQWMFSLLSLFFGSDLAALEQIEVYQGHAGTKDDAKRVRANLVVSQIRSGC